jgi:asparagine synthetase B (glutamine-hydrolysing)
VNVRVLGPLDPNFAWDGTNLLATPGPDLAFPWRIRGAAAWANRAGRGRWRIGRDPLGLNKLFWARETNGALLLASRPWRLVREGCAFEDVWAIPRGSVIELGPAEQQIETSSIGDGRQPFDEPFTMEVLGERIRSVLDTYMEAIASVHGGEQVYVCLSGGLDSSAIAALAREHFPRLVAVSFDLARRAGRASEDRRIAARLARDLGLDLLEVNVGADWLLETLDTVLLEGIDWRDFNVHAALVNAALARGIRDVSPKTDPVIVLTGDLANEFLADYQPEEYAGTTHYRLPRLASGALRASLIQGLDTCHREVGVFAAWDLAVVQPYAAAVDEYLAIPEEFLSDAELKRHLGRAVVGDLLPEYVFRREKTRAQVGGEGAEGGVLAACVDRGLDATRLRRRFADLHGIEHLSELHRFIRAGRYRAAVPSIAPRGDEHC